jgi:DeoR family transcriptional regulator, suf operon transcriptional repressor
MTLTGRMNPLSIDSRPNSLPETRRTLLEQIKRQGEVAVDRLAAAAEMTVSGTRQHLVALERDGLIAYREVREGPGRPRHLYSLTAAGDALFPRAYAELTNELLEYVESEDPKLLERIFDRRGQRRLEQARARTAGLAFAEKVGAVAQILDEDGYLADFERRADGAYVITERNCAVLSVARRYRHACGSELTFLQAALPEADVERIAHQLTAGHVCAYEIRPRLDRPE